MTVLLVYVDDIVLTGNNILEIEKVKQFLCTKFLIKDLGKLKYFLGIEVVKSDKGLCLSQSKYCLELLSDFGLLGSKHVSTPLESNITIHHVDNRCDNDLPLSNITEYQKLIGKLIYLTLTRSDISYTVQCISQYMHAPLTSHLKIALRLLRYLKTAPEKGILFSKCENLSLNTLVDCNWVKCITSRR
ncbi:uncharacterized mitochondrial protein AtMg00810-like [Rutidosis leptorrhynchoides]|uniref:uncharacterized mitochondrial protein AtMg00810-like n=1 Tax=Rutidosis leptorrhynchoides TaxID=125765 RepID=UPI003A990F88